MLGRVDKLISLQLNISRNDTKTMLKSGRITVNGVVVKKPETKIDTEKDIVCIDKKEIDVCEFVYLMMNKPKSVLCASTDKRAKTVIDIVQPDLKRKGLFCVGRLDKDTTGLLLITDDGDFSHKVISPKSMIPKKYEVEVDGIITEQMITIFKEGIVLADGTKCLPATLTIISDNVAHVVIYEGKYHQIKRMFGVVNLGVVNLKRLQIGGLKLDESLKEGEMKKLSKNELSSIFNEKYC